MDQLTHRGVNCATTSGLLTAAGAETVYDTTATINFVIRGIHYQKTAITDGVTPLLDYRTGVAFVPVTANKGCTLVWGLIAAGTVVVIQGPLEPMAGGAFSHAPQFPMIPEEVCPFAYQVLKGGATAGTIVVGTSNWNATGFTNSIKNVFGLPDRPQVA